MDEALSRLADLAGIEARYWDIEGRLHETSPETARHLLGALGLPAETQTEVLASLARLEERSWRETLPPVIVVTEGCEIAVPLRLSAAAAQNLRWSLDLEGGLRVEGEYNIADLAIESMGALDGAPIFLRWLRLPAQPTGYHCLRVETDAPFVSSLIVAPSRCYLPAPDHRYWGVAAQLYSVRSENNWGMGDFTDLRTLMDWAGEHGAAAVGVNPLHALFLDTPEDASPYSPSSRHFINPLYLDVTAIPDYAESAEACLLASTSAIFDIVRAVRARDIVDYTAVARAKLAVFEHLYRHFRSAHGRETDARRLAYHTFVAATGPSLYHFALFQMLTERFGTHDWRAWPQSWRSPDSTESLSPDQAERIEFFQYLQWQCAIQFAAAARRASGMPIGLYNDLAVGVDASGADHWAGQDLFLPGMLVGAPPDPFNEQGQNWGAAAFNPHRLRTGGYAQFISLMRANMRGVGALRIDHVMGWQRLFLIPAGAPASEGAYMHFPLDDLIGIAALESQRNKCIVIGEDLGTVPAGFRERMAKADILSCRILYFEREGDRFRRPGEFPARAVVSATTHDLATLCGYWTGQDIAAKARLGILKGDEERRSNEERARDKRLLLQALVEEGLLPHGLDPAVSDSTPWTSSLGEAIHAYLARSPAVILMVQLDDLTDEGRQINLPGSISDYPNWRRRLSRSIKEIAADAAITQTLTIITSERETPRTPA
ncbi:MAG: 4-alpha-glucanotransferase [Pseudomonadota bacterium]